MYKNWKDLIKPKALEIDKENLTGFYGKFVAKPLERGFQLVVSIVYEVAQNMDFTIRHISADFNTGYNSQLGKGFGSQQGWSNTIHGVMVGYSDNS